MVGDDELQPGQADAIAGNRREAKASSGLPTFIMILVRVRGMLSRGVSITLEGQLPS
jgi:hypothetical protein